VDLPGLFSSGAIFILKIVGVVLIWAVLWYALVRLLGDEAFERERRDAPQKARPFGWSPGPSRTSLGLSVFATYLIAWVWLDWF
jgi:hypothetical protein